MCTVHATLTHSPQISILAASELPAHEHEHALSASDGARPAP
jgi:hypothetical protein